MRLVMTLVVRDEEDILDWNLRYHLSRGVDHILVTDNGSIDGTTEILRGHEAEGTVTYLYEPDGEFSQDRWATRMAERAQSEFRPDWVLHSDADEFWWPEAGADLKQAFAAVSPEARAVAVSRHNFLGPAHDDGRPFFRRMIHRQRQSTNFFGTALPSKVAHRPLDRLYVHMGNHAVSDGDQVVEAEPVPTISILHFPARSPAQLHAKIAIGGAALERTTRFGPGVAATWRSMYADLKAGRFDRVLDAYFQVPGAEDDHDLVEDTRLRDYLSNL